LYWPTGNAIDGDRTGSGVDSSSGLPIVARGPTAVSAFFAAHAAKTVMLHGVSTRSVNHETCQIVSLTGGTRRDAMDWPTRLASEEGDAYDLPHLVLSGPVYPGEGALYVSRAEGRLQAALDGTLVRDTLPLVNPTTATLPLRPATGRILESFLERRAAAVRQASPGLLASQYEESQLRVHRLVGQRYGLRFQTGSDLVSRARIAVEAMAKGVTRVATLGSGESWDTHFDNALQATNADKLFTGLSALMEALSTTTDDQGVLLSEDTVVVVMSEMGRTPKYNASNGRDHWPFTSMLIVGAGVSGNRVIGGYDDGYIGYGIDSDGDINLADDDGVQCGAIGATLLAAGGIDPGRYTTYAPIPGIFTS
jgi:hypothetical protein